MMRARWRQDIRNELQRESYSVEEWKRMVTRTSPNYRKVECRRCGCKFETLEPEMPEGFVCDQCQYDDWHEEYPDLEAQEDSDG
jgi:formylmethanofuran dehydrogenase subunit E